MGFTLKLAVVPAIVLTTTLMFNLLYPFVTNYAVSDLANIWTLLISWLKPPYLYVVFNCIIITIVASSRLQSNHDDSHSVSTVVLQTELDKVILPVEIPQTHEPEVVFHGDIDDMKPVQVLEPEFSTPRLTDDFIDDDMKKPQGFSHWKPVKVFPEGSTTTLGVTKPKGQDTLDTTWKTITQSQSTPFTTHLYKPDTWETRKQCHQSPNSEELVIDNHSKVMTKSETLDVKKPPRPPQSKVRRSVRSGRLRKEASMGQEELNRRVEAFIKKVNEDMRLQRQESLKNQYMEMINRGAH